VFSQLDEDGSGYLSKNEVAGLKQIVDKRIEEKRRNAELHPEEMTTYAEFEALFEPGGECKSDCRHAFIQPESTLKIAY
jgi:hypothetical protein